MIKEILSCKPPLYMMLNFLETVAEVLLKDNQKSINNMENLRIMKNHLNVSFLFIDMI